MSEQSARSTTAAEPAFDIKAGQFNLPTLVLRDTDVSGLDDFLAQQVARLPAFFDQAPVAIDVSQLAEREQLDDFPMIVGMLRGHGMIPVGVRGASAAQRAQAQALELAIMPPGRRVAPRVDAVSEVRRDTCIVDTPVRSGQRIVADSGDLVLTADVSSGAEIVAAGHIHCYCTLRGRAMAGIGGDKSARIFCRRLAAELVSIAGLYRVSENLDDRCLGRAVQISLCGEALSFELL